jgi:glycosyltransferase involved in cell wall biosynthesis
MRKPTVLITGGFDTANVPEIDYGNQQPGFRRWRARFAQARADRVITNSEYLRGEIARNTRISPERVRVVHHGLADRFGAAEGDRGVVLTVGAVHTWNLERKGHRAFVEAAAELPELEFVLAGGWSDDAIDRLRAIAGDNVTFTGRLSDPELDREFRRAGTYVQASWHEGFGLSLAEAMLAGSIPVVTAAGALPEVAGDTGVTIAAVDARDIAAGVREAIALDSEAGAQARARILERFPLEARADGICREVDAALRTR